MSEANSHAGTSNANRASGSSSAIVRAARRDEVGAVWGMVLELAEYEKLLDRVTGSAATLEAHIFGAKPLIECLVAEREGALIGYALFFHTYSSFRTQPMMWLEDLFVRPEARGSGAGRALLKRLAEIVLERGGWRLSWEVLDWNEPSIKFYELMGARRAHSDWYTYALDEAGMRALTATRTK
jgi:GNAT superfamily N-acetyltransferase